MPLACPQCKDVFERAASAQRAMSFSCITQPPWTTIRAGSSEEDDGGHWQQTPWGKIVIGLISQGLSFGLLQL